VVYGGISVGLFDADHFGPLVHVQLARNCAVFLQTALFMKAGKLCAEVAVFLLCSCGRLMCSCTFFVFPCNKFDWELYWLMSNIHLFACAGEETLPKDVSRLLNCLKLLVQCIHDPGIQKRETGEKSLILLWWTVSVR
jgi:hypothetical protein